MAASPPRAKIVAMEVDAPHRPLCMIELIAEGQAERCPGAECPFWENGCILARIEADLDGRGDVAEFLLAIRRELEELKRHTTEDAHALFHRRLSAGRE
jgi:hypothetical protein